MKRNVTRRNDERRKIDNELVISINKVVASKEDTTKIQKHFKYAIANNMSRIKMVAELYERFPSYRHNDDLAKYFLMEKRNLSEFKLGKEIRELNMYHAIKEIIRYFEEKGKGAELTSTIIQDVLVAYTDSSVSIAEFESQDSGGISRFYRKIGLIPYESQYIDKNALKEKILKLYNDKGDLEGVSEKILISAFIRKILTRNEYTGYNSKTTQATRRKYVLYLLIDYDDCKNENDMRTINEIVKSLGFKLQRGYSKQLRQVEIGVTSLVITTFTKEAMQPIRDLFKNNYVYDVYSIRSIECDRILTKKIRIVNSKKSRSESRIKSIEKSLSELQEGTYILDDDVNPQEIVEQLNEKKQQKQQSIEEYEWRMAFYNELRKKCCKNSSIVKS